MSNHVPDDTVTVLAQLLGELRNAVHFSDGVVPARLLVISADPVAYPELLIEEVRHYTTHANGEVQYLAERALAAIPSTPPGDQVNDESGDAIGDQTGDQLAVR